MAALVQTFPAQTSVSMMQGRPGSADRYGSQSSYRTIQKHSNSPSNGYRGLSGPAPTYAFTSTPQLGSPNSQRPQNSYFPQNHLRTTSSSSGAIPQLPQLNFGPPNSSQRPNSVLGLSGSLSSSTVIDPSGLDNNVSLPAPNITAGASVKPSPDRYRRAAQRTDSGDGSTSSQSSTQMYSQPTQSNSSPSLNTYQSYRATTYTAGTQTRKASNDDMMVGRSTSDLASRYRRRSMGPIEVPGLNHTGDAQDTSSPHPNSVVQAPTLPTDHRRPTSSHTHTGSSESINSRSSDKSSRPSSARNESSNSSVTNTGPVHPSGPKQDPRALHVPSNSVPGVRRVPSPLSNPSPLSRPVNIANEDADAAANQSTRPKAQIPLQSSPAAEQLAALNSKELKKPKSKLRRAFSFGSTAELRKATAQANLEKSTQAAVAAKRNSKFEDELDPEQAKIAQRQEAGGLGESIYSGQGNFFTGSTDNLSVSSTASSASMMLRKMGKGMKKGTRSLVGLFRPKSVLGVPAADGPVNAAAAAQISMVSVEAEREKVNVNLDPHAHQGGGTGFPKLERNSIDNKMSMDSGRVSHDVRPRRSIVGGERERAEVLAAVKKGILKRTDSNQSSPSLRPNNDFNLPNVPHMTESPRSSAPSTPVDEPPRSSHRRTDSVTIETNDHDDYFTTVTRYVSLDSKNNGPLTPQTSIRNITFSPRIQFHDTWPSGEYDRRGEIATCNRLTPMLAQQIKEELNTFKMVCKCVPTQGITELIQTRRWKYTSPLRFTHISSRQ